MAHDTEKLRELLERAYAFGFAASGEGWNAEYPFSQHGLDPANNAHWAERQDERVSALISQAEGEAQHG